MSYNKVCRNYFLRNISSKCKMHTLIEAIHYKYDQLTANIRDENSFIQVFVPKAPPQTQAGRINLPPRLTLDDLQISTAGDGREILELCANVTELDLTKNSIKQWTEVFSILEHMPGLKFLNLTFNQLDNASFDESRTGSSSKLDILVLNDTGLSWHILAQLLEYFPSLTELHISLNKFTSVDLPPEFRHNALTKLFMNNCDIEDWSEISKLSVAFPCLQLLNIIQIPVRKLSDDKVYTEFPELCALNISNSQLESWDEIDKFCRFPSLTNLRIAEVPFLETIEAKPRRQELVARLYSILSLNGTEITETERENAERVFIRNYINSENKPSRYAELERKHGKLEPLVDIDLSAPSHYYNYLKMLVKFEDKEEEMEIDLFQNVLEFRKLLRNFTGLPPSKTSIFYMKNWYKNGRQIELDFLKRFRKLETFGMRKGDEIHIVRKSSTKERQLQVDV